MMGCGDIGDVLCAYVKKHNIDFLVIGRRDLGAISRFFLGSSSKHCVENAECNVIVMKHPFGPDVVHDDSKEQFVAVEEEEERKWSILDYQHKLEDEARKEEEESKKEL
jgi:Universal stress protein family